MGSVREERILRMGYIRQVGSWGDPETPQGDGRAMSPGGLGPGSGPGGGRVTWALGSLSSRGEAAGGGAEDSRPSRGGREQLGTAHATAEASDPTRQNARPQERLKGGEDFASTSPVSYLPSPEEKPPGKGMIRLPGPGRHGDFRARSTPGDTPRSRLSG